MTDSLLGVLMFSDRAGALVIARAAAIETVSIEAAPDGDFIAAAAECLAELRLGPGPAVTLGLASAHCVTAIVERSGLLRSEREQAMRYRLEESLPLDAEDLATAFVPIDRSCALGVATEIERVQDLIDGFMRAGIDIGPIAPTALLTVEQIDLGPTLDSAAMQLIRLDQPSGGIDLMALQNRTPRGWRHVASDDADAITHAVLSLEHAFGAEQSDQAARELDGPPTASDRLQHVPSERFVEAAARGAALAARRTRAGLADLRHGPLARRNRLDTLRPAWLSAGLAACLMLGSILGVALWQTQANDAAIDAVRDTERAAFAELYPGKPVPLSIAARLRSELATLQGQRAPTTLQTNPPVLPTLVSLLEATPRDLRVQLDELRLDGNRVVLDGAARSHAQAAQLGRAISSQSVVDLEPPYTENLPDQGVGFTLTGEVRPDAPTSDAGRLAADRPATPDPEGGL